MVHASRVWQKGNVMQVRAGFTTQQLNMLCQYSYGIGRGDVKTRPGLHLFEDPALGSYWVLRSRYCPENGFEGMITAPDLEGGPDHAHLVVVYAGTNLRDDPRHDIHAALTCFLPPLNGEPGQTQQAGILAEQALDLARRRAGTDRGVLFTGHSLGGGLALIQAAEQDLPARVFCAADPWRVLDQEQRQRVARHHGDGKFLDYRLGNDRVTGTANRLLSGQADRSAYVVWCGKGPSRFGHWLGDFDFDQGGEVLAETPLTLAACPR